MCVLVYFHHQGKKVWRVVQCTRALLHWLVCRILVWAIFGAKVNIPPPPPSRDSPPTQCTGGLQMPSNAFKCINPPGALHICIEFQHWHIQPSDYWLHKWRSFADLFLWSLKTSRRAMEIKNLRKIKNPNNIMKLICFCYYLWDIKCNVLFMAFQFSCNWIFPIIVVCEWTLSSGEMTLPPISPFVCFLTFPQFEFTFSVKLHSSFTKVAQKKVFQ